jgi:hypothetical protein
VALSPLAALLALWPPAAPVSPRQDTRAVMSSHFAFDTLPAPSVHASTIVEASGVLLAAWFGGRHEGAEDVGIWVSRLEDGVRSPPFEAANGIQPDGRPQVRIL